MEHYDWDVSGGPWDKGGREGVDKRKGELFILIMLVFNITVVYMVYVHI